MYNSLFITLWFLIFCSCANPKKQKLEEKSPPNIIFILSDDQAWGDYGFMGHPYIKTPNIDQLVQKVCSFCQTLLKERPQFQALDLNFFALI